MLVAWCYTSSSSSESTNHVSLVITNNSHLLWLHPPLIADMEHWGRVRLARFKVTGDNLQFTVNGTNNAITFVSFYDR